MTERLCLHRRPGSAWSKRLLLPPLQGRLQPTTSWQRCSCSWAKPTGALCKLVIIEHDVAMVLSRRNQIPR